MASASATVALLGPSQAGLVRRASDSDGGRLLPVLPELRPVLPGGGLRRGSTVAVAGGTSLMLALLAAASQAGSWCTVVGMPTLGAAAAAEIGVDLSRLALVPHPGPEWPAVVAALVDGVDIVVVAPPGPIAAPVSTRLAARARQRGCVLVPFGGQWPGAEVTLAAVHAEWEGLGQGHGRLRRRMLTISAHGRGAAARPKQARLWLPRREVSHGLWLRASGGERKSYGPGAGVVWTEERGSAASESTREDGANRPGARASVGERRSPSSRASVGERKSYGPGAGVVWTEERGSAASESTREDGANRPGARASVGERKSYSRSY